MLLKPMGTQFSMPLLFLPVASLLFGVRGSARKG